MTKMLTLANHKDVPVVYNFVKLLARTHGKDGGYFNMSAKRFIDSFNKELFRVNLYKEAEHEISGIMLHMKEYSLKSREFGCYLDDFYLDSSLRGKGLGSKMLGELCGDLLKEGQNYIKVVFNNNLKLESFYNRLGFVNFSDKCSLNLYEGNNSDLRNILNTTDNEPNEIQLNKVTNVGIFPIYEIIVKKGLEVYSFCCQFNFNSWSGFGILLTDFTGETTIARLSDFRGCIERLLTDVGWEKGVIQSVWWHVLDHQLELGNCISSCLAENTSDEGWKVSYLNKEGMENLSKLSNTD